jgi:hypothetical protein
MKVERKIYKGIEYVLFSELPQTQQEKLLQTLSVDAFIKIMIDGTIVSRCIQFKDYSNWYEIVYKTKPVVVKEALSETALTVSSSLAFK